MQTVISVWVSEEVKAGDRGAIYALPDDGLDRERSGWRRATLTIHEKKIEFSESDFFRLMRRLDFSPHDAIVKQAFKFVFKINPTSKER